MMIKKIEKYGRFKEAYVYTHKGECLSCGTKGVVEYIDTLEKALDKACEEVMYWTYSSFTVLKDDENYGIYPNFDEVKQWKEYFLKEVQEDE